MRKDIDKLEYIVRNYCRGLKRLHRQFRMSKRSVVTIRFYLGDFELEIFTNEADVLVERLHKYCHGAVTPEVHAQYIEEVELYNIVI